MKKPGLHACIFGLVREVGFGAFTGGLLAMLVMLELSTATSADSRQLKSNNIAIQYVEPTSDAHIELYKILMERRSLEKMRDLLSPLRLPHQLLLQVRDCGGIPNAWSDENSVTVCYEFLEEVRKNAPTATTPSGITREDALVGQFLDVFLHEVGHATFRALRIPIFGKEEDAADQFSTYILLQFDKDEVRRLILGNAYQYKSDISSPAVTITTNKFADEHGTPAQRFYNLLCMAYGSDPVLFDDAVKKGFLPEDRAIICAREYAQVSYAFETLIGPYIDKKLTRQNWKWFGQAGPKVAR